MKPPLYKKLYNYESITQINNNGPRMYQTPDDKYVHSVTTILSATADKTGIENWKKRVGKEVSDKEIKQATDIGNLLHNNLENFIKNIDNPKPKNFIQTLALRMSDEIIKNCIINVNEFWGSEVPLYFPNLYAGTTDLVGLYNNKPAIMDFKNSKKIKKEEWIIDYYLQGCAYAQAHNYLFETKINDVVIFMVDRNCNTKTFHINEKDFDYYSELWCQRLEQFLKIS